MNIEIRKLVPDLAEDYACFFDTTPHWGHDDTKCYCISWCGDNVYHNGGSHWYSSPDDRRVHAIQRVRDGDIQGYLAYCDGEVVGWCNANTKSDCRECMNHLRSEGVPIEECHEGEKVKFIFCFTVAPKAQRMGVATQLLRCVCRDAAADGFDFIEAHTNKKFAAATDFWGPMVMYEKCGFSKQGSQDEKIVMRKTLKE